MFGRISSLLLLFAFSGISYLQAQPDSTVAIEEKNHYMNVVSGKRGKRSTANLDITYHRLVLAPSLKNGSLNGSVHTIFKPVASVSTIDFDLHRNMQVDSVIYHKNTVAYAHTGDILNIFLPGTIAANQVDSVSIYYHGMPSNDQGSYEFSSHADIPIIFTLSEPYGAHYWWPCKENLSDKIDSLDCFVLTDTGKLAAGNGLLVNTVAVNDSQVLFHWKHRYPIATYLVALAVTNYRQFSYSAPVAQHSQQVEILNYVYPENYNTALNDVKETIKIMTLFDSLFGTYPFANEKYGHAQFNRNGGMEHQTMSFMGHFRFDLIAHELAHQWFGNRVTTGAWKDLWLNEGFATYLNMLCYNYLKSDDEWQSLLKKTRDNVLSDPGGSVFIYDTTDVGRMFDARLTYNKGAMVLHMLRWKLGSDTFFKAIRNYLSDPAHSYGFARNDDLKKHLEAASGQDLTRFFNEWYYSEGYPLFTISWKQKGNLVQVNFRQKTSHVSVKNFQIPVELRFSGNNLTKDVVFNITDSIQSFKVTLPFKVNSITFDPHTWLLAKADVLNEGFSESEAFDVYPNPARDELRITANKTDADRIRLINMAGQCVYDQSYPNRITTGQTESIPLKNLANGVYLIEISAGKSVYKQKILKY